MRILGISAFYHDSAAALVVNGEVRFAAQEERFTRKKHDAGFPTRSIHYCLRESGCSLRELDAIVFYDKPFIKFERLFETYLAFVPFGRRMFQDSFDVWIREKLFLKDRLLRELRAFDPVCRVEDLLLFNDHHLSHAASAFFPSPFSEAAILTLDGVGEWTTTATGFGQNNNLEMKRAIRFPHSLGLLYSAFTTYCGFKVNSGEYKLMGLAPYGRPLYAQKILENLIDLKADGSFRLNMEYFDYGKTSRMFSRKFCKLFGGPGRGSDDLLTPRHMDLAASIQQVLEEAVLRLTRALHRETASANLCLAGGVALNCVANGKILKDGKFKNIWIQPAAGDAGGAIGAALAAYHLHFKQPRTAKGDGMKGAYLGPQFTQQQIEQALGDCGATFEILAPHEMLTRTAQDLEQGRAVGWFQGRMEFGPRALGNRSILADARANKMQSQLNLKVKFRESFRPFAPAVLAEDLPEWFDLDKPTPYMLLVADVLPKHRTPVGAEDKDKFGIDLLNVPRSRIPAVTHVDYSARIQTVHTETNPLFHALLAEFKARTGCSVVVNTSFNVRGEPIVCTPRDAFHCFMGTDIDRLAIGGCYLRKESQTAPANKSYRDKFELD